MSWEWLNGAAGVASTTTQLWEGVPTRSVGTASMVALIVTIGTVISGWHLKRLQADIHASTQLTLTDMRKGFSESQQAINHTREHGVYPRIASTDVDVLTCTIISP